MFSLLLVLYIYSPVHSIFCMSSHLCVYIKLKLQIIVNDLIACKDYKLMRTYRPFLSKTQIAEYIIYNITHFNELLESFSTSMNLRFRFPFGFYWISSWRAHLRLREYWGKIFHHLKKNVYQLNYLIPLNQLIDWYNCPEWNKRIHACLSWSNWRSNEKLNKFISILRYRQLLQNM